jgi:hypothetical protein
MSNSKRLSIAAVTLSVLASCSGALAEEAPAAEAPAPQVERFIGTIMLLNAPVTGMGRVTITVERWTTVEERKKLAEALRAGGTEALVEAMNGLEAGYIQIENNLRWPVRVASTWSTDKGRKVRVATNRPINYEEARVNTRTMDYPIGFVELLLPPEGKGEGTLVAAAQAEIGTDGHLAVRSLPSSTGPQKVTNVEVEIVKPKKSKTK